MRFFQILISHFLKPCKSISKTPYKLWSQKKAYFSSLPCLGLKGGSETVQPAIQET